MSQELEVNYITSLKHRLVGAAILIAFGVIVLPWVLGSYSSTKSVSNASVGEKTAEELPTIESVMAAIDGEPEKEVKVFVSRVQPLDNSNSSKPSESKPIDVVTSEVEPVKAVEKVVVTEKPADKKAEPLEIAKPKTEPKKSAVIDNGYIVSVGVFGNTENVQKMLTDLKSKSFKPSVRQEKFNSKTVSRIYMGPFATRAEAGRVKLKLYEKENIPSLIKEFP